MRRLVVTTLAVLLGTSIDSLGQVLGSLFTPITAVRFLVFTLLYTPCVAAVAAVRRELDSSLKTLTVVISQCVIAWITAFVVYTVGRLLF